jgi:uncharacterized SAM-binding protein YcdF (DUF218 family)
MWIIKKLVLFCVTAPGLFFIILLANIIVFNLKKLSQRSKFIFLLASLLLTYIVTTSIITKPLLHRMEGDCSFEIRTLSKIDAIAIPTAGTEKNFESDPFSKATGTTIKRLVAGAAIYNVIKKPIIILGGKMNAKEPAESVTGASILIAMGIPSKNIVTEENSTNTRENINELEKNANKLGIKNIALVSSASHIPRIKGLLKNKELNVTLIPTACNASNKVSSEDFVPSIRNMEINFVLLYELLGNVKYAIGNY